MERAIGPLKGVWGAIGLSATSQRTGIAPECAAWDRRKRGGKRTGGFRPLLERFAVGTSRARQESCDKEFAMKASAKVPR